MQKKKSKTTAGPNTSDAPTTATQPAAAKVTDARPSDNIAHEDKASEQGDFDDDELWEGYEDVEALAAVEEVLSNNPIVDVEPSYISQGFGDVYDWVDNWNLK
jgi:hypothetical protein